jgi:hypothetical protein
MRLLRKITGYATVNLATPTHSDNDELGDRIPMEIQEGTVHHLLLVHTITTTIAGGTKGNLEAVRCSTPTNTIGALAYHGIAISGAGLSQTTPATTYAFQPAAANNVAFHLVSQERNADSLQPILAPYVSFLLDTDRTAGAWTTEVYLYGEPHKYSDIPIGGSTTSTSNIP